MPLQSGTRLGSYEVIRPLGAGGMGEVYEARDTKLGRNVAIKILLDAFVADAERIARFEREARALAALNHPNIAILHGADRAEGQLFLIMELVEGETLAERLRQGPIPLEQTLGLARQIAEALEAAHEKGIVHRDLKPANVKVTPDGNVKVLDFGLAKAAGPEPSSSSIANSPTISAMATQAGVILGTAAYMSPEQAKGFPADHRSDVFSFGVVLYEMLVGRQPFQGETVSDVLASVLVREAELDGLPSALNPRLPDLIRRCLEKSPKRRWQAIGDVRAELETIAASPRMAPTVPGAAIPPRPWWRRAVPIALAAIVGAGAMAAVWLTRASAGNPAPVVRFSMALDDAPIGAARRMLAISPDGTRLVFAANSTLYLRHLSALDVRPILSAPATGVLGLSAFSPDGESLAYFDPSDSSLKRITISGGAPVPICKVAENPSGLEWNGDAVFFSQAAGIMRVSANGGQPEVVAKVEGGDAAHGAQLLPDGKTLLFSIAPAGSSADRWAQAKIVTQSLETGERTTVLEGGTEARYLPTGHLVYIVNGVLFAVRFDLKQLKTVGSPASVVEGVRRPAGGIGGGSAHLAISETGTLVYQPGPITSATAVRSVAMVDQTGKIEMLKTAPGAYTHARLSPNGRLGAFSHGDGDELSIWIADLSGATAPRRLTFGGNYRYPTWAPDSERVVFQSTSDADRGLFVQRADGTGPVTRLTQPDKGVVHFPLSWSPEGAHLLVDVAGGATGSRQTLSVLSVKDGTLKPFSDVGPSEAPSNAIFSPDGRWVAYTFRAAPTSPAQLFVQPFPPTGAKYLVSRSSESGHHAVWAPSGDALFYTPGPGPRITRVPVSTKPSFNIGEAVVLPRPFTNSAPSSHRTYDIGKDGRFFGLVDPAQPEGTITASVQVVLNWFEELKKRLPNR